VIELISITNTHEWFGGSLMSFGWHPMAHVANFYMLLDGDQNF
jgi:hypothetical protein